MNREFKFQLEKVEDSGEFHGVAAVYGNVDLGSDVIERGAFSKTVADNGGVIPLLLEHRIPIGIARIEDSDVGLKTHGILNMGKEIARDAYSDLKFYRDNGKPYGMSIGYEAIRKKREGDIRFLKEVRLFEASITIMPMNPLARVSNVKSEDGDNLIEQWFAALEALKTHDVEKFEMYMEKFSKTFSIPAPHSEAASTSTEAAQTEQQEEAATAPDATKAKSIEALKGFSLFGESQAAA